MVVCLVDDLFFSIKIKTAAQLLHAEVFFQRTFASAVETIRTKHPRLVILDLDSATLRPLDVVAAMKADAGLSTVPTLGFVSHVHNDVIAAARAGGVDQVMARSAFADRLGSILSPAS